jgi:hypothetical protein
MRWLSNLLSAAVGLALVMASLATVSCGGAYEETIGGVAVPVPKGMTRTSETPMEISLLGFGAGQATFHGVLDAEAIVDFYRKELPDRGWRANMNLRSGGSMLAYSKDGKTLLVGVGKENGKTSLSLTVTGIAR